VELKMNSPAAARDRHRLPCFFLALVLYRAPLNAVGAILAHTSPIWLRLPGLRG
jgi:hypothetical protein